MKKFIALTKGRFNNFYRNLHSIIRKNQLPALAMLTFIFYWIFCFVPDNKILVALFIAYFLCVFWILKNFRLALFYAYLASLPFPDGKSISLEFIPASVLNLPLRERGLESVFIISLKDIVVLGMALLMLRDWIVTKKPILKMNRNLLLLLFYLLSIMGATALGSVYPQFSALYWIYEARPLIIYVYARYLLSKNQSLIGTLKTALGVAIVFEFILSVFQFGFGTSFGKPLIASTPIFPEDDPELGGLAARPSGTFSHPTDLSFMMISYGSLFLPELFSKKSVLVILPLFMFLTVIMTLSRGSWLALFIAVVIFLYVTIKKWHIHQHFNYWLRRQKRILIMGTLILVSALIIPRLINSFYFVGSEGGLNTRIKQYGITGSILNSEFLFGVGLEMDTIYSYLYTLNIPSSIFKYFPEPVHNYFLRLFVQVGIFPLVFLILITLSVFISLIRAITKSRSTKQKMQLLSVALNILVIYIYANIQPVFNLSHIVLISVLFLNQKGANYDF